LVGSMGGAGCFTLVPLSALGVSFRRPTFRPLATRRRRSLPSLAVRSYR